MGNQRSRGQGATGLTDRRRERGVLDWLIDAAVSSDSGRRGR